MGYKYPKHGYDYENDHWRKIADRQTQNRAMIYAGLIIAAIIAGIWTLYPSAINGLF